MRFFRRLFSGAPTSRAGVRKGRQVLVDVMVRSYQALSNRLFADLKLWRSSPDDDVYRAITEYREASRELVHTNDYAKRYLDLTVQNVVGPDGFILKNQAMEQVSKKWVLDSFANTTIEDAWADFCKPENFSVDGRLSCRDMSELAMMAAARDGEFFVRLAFNKGKYKVQLQLLDPEWVDEQLNEPATREHPGDIIMGVEVDKWGRPLAYHVLDADEAALMPPVSAGAHMTRKHVRIPANQILHGFRREFSRHTRGVSWMAQSVSALKMLGGFEEAALVNARASAAKMGFIKKTMADGQPYVGNDTDADGNIIQELSPGTIEQLNYGEDFVANNPTFPNGDFPEYVKSQLRRIAAGLGVSYASLTGDLSDVNYSSIRAGLVEERVRWRHLQGWFAQAFLVPLFARWLEIQLTVGNIKLPIAKLDKFNAPKFIGRTWDWVDPEKDINAEVSAIRAGFKTFTEVLQARGHDTEEVFIRLAEERELAAKYGLTLEPFTSKNPAAPAAPKEEPMEDEVEDEEDAPPGKEKADDAKT